MSIYLLEIPYMGCVIAADERFARCRVPLWTHLDMKSCRIMLNGILRIYPRKLAIRATLQRPLPIPAHWACGCQPSCDA